MTVLYVMTENIPKIRGFQEWFSLSYINNITENKNILGITTF